MACLIPENKVHQELIDRFGNSVTEEILSKYYPNTSNSITLEEVLNNQDIVDNYLEDNTIPLSSTSNMFYSDKLHLFNSAIYNGLQMLKNERGVDLVKFVTSKDYRKTIRKKGWEINGVTFNYFEAFFRKGIKKTLVSDIKESYIEDFESEYGVSNIYTKINNLGKDILQYFDKIVNTNIADYEESKHDNENAVKDTMSSKRNDEVDLFNEMLTQIKLLALTQQGETENSFLEPKDYMYNIFNNIDLQKNATFEQFRKNIVSLTFPKNYLNVAHKNILKMAGFYNENPTEDEFNLQNLLYKAFGKTENTFIVTKIYKDGGISILNQGRENFIDDSYNKIVAKIQDNVDEYKGKEVLPKDKVLGIEEKRKLYDDFFGTTFLKNYSKFDSLDLNMVTKSIIDGYNKNLSVEEILKKENKKLRKIAELQAIHAGDNAKIFSLKNADGDTQHSLSNHSVVHKKLHNIQSIGIAKLEQLDQLNGSQEDGTPNTSLFSKQSLEDMSLQFIDQVMHNNTIPYIFNGDKTTEFAVTFSGYNQDNTGNLMKVLDYEIDFITKNYQHKDSIKDIQFELPTFDAFGLSNSDEYKNIKSKAISNTPITDVEKKALIELMYSDNHSNHAVAKLATTMFEKISKKTGIGRTSLRKKPIGGINALNKESYDERFMRDFLVKYAVLMAEQQAGITGSLNYYKDPTKRLSAATATKEGLRYDKQYIKHYNNVHPSSNPISEKGIRVITVEDIKGDKDKGFEGNSTDAQAYVTRNFHRYTLKASGLWNDTLNNLFNQIDEIEKRQDLNEADYEGLNKLYIELNNASVEVSKPQYFGNDLNTGQPVFLKMSVLPLSKALSNGKGLDNIRQMLEDSKSDILIYDSGIKLGRKLVNGEKLSIHDNKGNITYKDDAVNYQQLLDWNGYGIQVQQAPSKKKINLGVQIANLIDLNENGNQEIVEKHQELLIKKLQKQEKDFIDEFNIDSNFNIDINHKSFKFFKDKVIKLAISKNMSLGFIDSLQNSSMMDFINNKTLVQNALTSAVRKKAMTIKLTGDSKAMVSSAGFQVEGREDLQFYKINEDGSSTGVEVYVPYNTKFKDLVEWDNKAKMYFPKKNLNDKQKKMFEAVAYRIPTQPDTAFDKITIKGFLPAMYSNTIVVPAQLPYKQGSDFDIDKLNLLLRNFDDLDSIDNQLLDLYLDILNKPEYLKKMKSITIDNKQIEDTIKASKNISKDDLQPKKNSILAANKALDQRFTMLQAKETLGIVATHVTNHAVAIKYGLGFKSSWKVDNFNVMDVLNSLIPKNKLQDLMLNRTEIIINGQTMPIADALSQLINATVDAAKDPYIALANFNIDTANTALFMLRVGVPFDNIVDILTNKEVVEYIKTKQLKKGITYDTDHVNTWDMSGYTLNKYKVIENASRVLSNFVNNSRFDAKLNGKTIEENSKRLFDFKNIQKQLSEVMINYDNFLSDKNSQTTYRNLAKNSSNFVKNLFTLEKLKLISDEYIEQNFNSSSDMKEQIRLRRNFERNVSVFKSTIINGLVQSHLTLKEAVDLKKMYSELKTAYKKLIVHPSQNDPLVVLAKSLNFNDNVSNSDFSVINLRYDANVDTVYSVMDKLYNKSDKTVAFFNKLAKYTILTQGNISFKNALFPTIPSYIVKNVLFGYETSNIKENSRQDIIGEILASTDDSRLSEIVEVSKKKVLNKGKTNRTSIIPEILNCTI